MNGKVAAKIESEADLSAEKAIAEKLSQTDLPPEYDKAIAELWEMKGQTAADVISAHARTMAVGKNVLRIPVKLEIVLGSLTVPVSQLMAMTNGEVISLDKSMEEGLEIHVNGSRIGVGELVVADDHTGLLGVRVTQLDNED